MNPSRAIIKKINCANKKNIKKQKRSKFKLIITAFWRYFI